MPLLSLQALPGSVWTPEGVQDSGPVFLAPASPLRSSRCRRRCHARCRGRRAEGGGEEEEEAWAGEGRDGAKGPWLQIESFLHKLGGWPSHQRHPNGHKLVAWSTVGGALFLAIGFTLGAHSLRAQKGNNTTFLSLVPAKEQVISVKSIHSLADQESQNDDSVSTDLEIDKKEEAEKQEAELAPTKDIHDLQAKETDKNHLSLPFDESDDFSRQAIDATWSTAHDLTTVQLFSTLDSNSREDMHEYTTNNLTTSFIGQENSVSYSTSSPLEPTVITEKSMFEDNIIPMPAEGSLTEMPSPSLHPIAAPPALTSVMFSSDNSEQDFISPLEKVTSEDGSFNQFPSEGNASESLLVGDLGENQSLTSTEEQGLDDLPEFGSSNAVSELGERMQTQVNGFNYLFHASTSDTDALGHIELSGSTYHSEIRSPIIETEDFHFPKAVPAPISPAEALPVKLGKIIVPAVVDHMQEQAVAALQALKVIEASIEPGAICTRREYARWLIAASSILSRSPAHKVFPAMYIENISEPAFDDVSPQDPDFPYIQGLAEAGLISSKFTRWDMLEASRNRASFDSKEILFFPDSPVTRQDLVTWKMAMEKRLEPVAIKEVLYTKSGFIDIDKIDKDAWPALLTDLSAGDRSIVALAFGYIRRFQPDKPVTRAQVAIALSTGEAADVVSEELARLEVESIAEAAVAAELAMESKAQQEVAVTLNQLLEEETSKKEAANKSIELMHTELQRLKAERDEERDYLLREQAVVEAEREFLFRLQKEVEGKSESLANVRLEVAFEKETMEKLRLEAEAERTMLANLRAEVEVEKKALIMARSWAEEEAKKAYSHAKVLEAAMKRWENQGLEVHTDEQLDESNIPVNGLQQSHSFLEPTLPTSSLLAKGRNFPWEVMDILMTFLYRVRTIVNQSMNKATKELQDMQKRALELKDTITSIAASKSESLHGSIYSSTGIITSGLREGTKKVVDECKGGAGKLAQKLKFT